MMEVTPPRAVFLSSSRNSSIINRVTSDKRRKTRVPFEVKIEYRTVGSFLSDWSANISQGGLFIQTANPLKEGTSVRMIFSLPGIPLLFDLNGRVRWTQPGAGAGKPAGMGIEFVHVDDRIRKRIQSYIKSIDEDVPRSLGGRKTPAYADNIALSGSAPGREDITQPDVKIVEIKKRTGRPEDDAE